MPKSPMPETKRPAQGGAAQWIHLSILSNIVLNIAHADITDLWKIALSGITRSLVKNSQERVAARQTAPGRIDRSNPAGRCFQADTKPAGQSSPGGDANVNRNGQ